MARILVVAPTPFFSDRGTHIRILEEALALEKLGHEITIATYHIGRDISREIVTKIDVRRIRRFLFWYKKLEAGPDWQKIILDLMLIRKTFYLARTKKPDIIHTHLHEGVLIGFIVQKLLFWRKMKLVADFHGSLVGEMRSHGYLKLGLKRIFTAIERFINRLGDFAIASSWETTQYLKRDREDGKIETVLDGAKISSLKNLSQKEVIRREWEIPENRFVIGYTGGLVPNKGIAFLLKAIPKVLSRCSEAFFLIGGFPPEAVEKFIKTNKFERSVRLVSPINYFKLSEFLSLCDIAVDPKGVEAKQASGKILNYMGAGLPIVCFDKENNRKYVGDGARYAKPENGETLAEKILELSVQPAEWKRMGEKNISRAEKFSWEESARKIETIYNRLIIK